jgi:hypothetical protein
MLRLEGVSGVEAVSSAPFTGLARAAGIRSALAGRVRRTRRERLGPPFTGVLGATASAAVRAGGSSRDSGKPRSRGYKFRLRSDEPALQGRAYDPLRGQAP